jgi:cytochrome P450
MTTAAPSLPLPVPRYPGHPIFGNLPSFRHDRAGMQLRVARALPDAAGLRMGFFPAVMFSNPALGYEVLQTKASSFTKAPMLTIFLRPVLGKGLLTSEGSFHAAQRKLLAPAFMHKRIASYADTMSERAARWAASVEHGKIVDVAAGMMGLTLEIVGKTLFDAEVGADADAVGDALTTAMRTATEQIESMVPVPPFVPTPKNLRLKRAVARLDAILYRIIRARRAAGDGDRGDLLSMLLAAQHEDGARMNDKQVRDEAMTLFLAGHETTANTMAWTFYLLAKNPDARAKLEAEVDALGHAPTYDDLKKLPYTLAVLKESMRLYPPAYMIARRAVEPVEIGEHRLAKGTIAFVNILGIHRRPDLWPEPEAFRPERFLGDAEKQLPRGAYLPFGAGPRICIGNHFALMEGHVLLATIAQRLRFDRTTDAPVALEPLVTLRPKGGIAMQVTVRGGSPC